jgi:hypothetical protein
MPKDQEPLISVARDSTSHIGKGGQRMREEFRDPAPLDRFHLTDCDVSQLEGSSENDLPQSQDLIAGMGRKGCCSKVVPDHCGARLPDKGTSCRC